MILNIPIPPKRRATAPVIHAGLLTAEKLRELLSYCLESGIFRWRVDRGGMKAGSVAGRINSGTGYCEISISYKRHQAHRLAWLYVHGVWPSAEIDHIDRDKTNNRISNLREASHAENMRNRGKYENNASGHSGVSWNKTKQKWMAQITHEGRRIHLGFYIRKEDAIAARIAGEVKYWGAARSI